MVKNRLDWTNILVLSAAHLAALGAVAYLFLVQFSWWTIGLTLVWGVACSMAITGGYHRLFAHLTYRANSLLKLFYLLFGAASVQNSALKWSADHRDHHAHTDQEKDPYNIRRGFWWAHIGWVCHQTTEETDYSKVRDLRADRLVEFQDRYYVLLAFLMAAVVPAGLGCLWGDPIGAVLVAGFLRLVVQWHITFSINSFTHLFGSQSYSTSNSARDSSWTALITFGEGYHNFHHRFQYDYRNGVRWFHFDPTKWFVWSLSKVGLTRDLKRTSTEAIERAKQMVLGKSQGQAGA